MKLLSPRFYSTYEELKLTSGSMLALILSRFYSTYEELKLEWFARDGLTLLSFYSTYEELKLQSAPSTVKNDLVFTVPMRN